MSVSLILENNYIQTRKTVFRIKRSLRSDTKFKCITFYFGID